MVRTFGAVAMLALAAAMPAQEVAAQDIFGGALLGGIAGGAIGGAVTRRGSGVLLGAAIGATTGALIAAEAQRRRGGYHWWRDGCYYQRDDGAWFRVKQRYCR